MYKSVVAIVGRPNVGKSTLFNRLCRKRSAIVDYESGVTRDRKYEDVEWNNKLFTIVDTGGIVVGSDEKIDREIRYQAEIAIQESDLILFVVDAHTGTTDLDMELGKLLFPHRDKVILVANKVDNEKYELELYDFLQLGLGDAIPISAAQGRNIGNFLDVVLNSVPSTVDFDEVEDDSIPVAIIGKPNVGKSSITNRLIGENSLIVDDVPGTTRDSIDTDIKYHNKKIVLIDTAGLRKKRRIKYGVEYFSSMRTIDSIDRAQVVILVIDSVEKVSTQDQKIASYAFRKNKNIIIVVNKWDLIEKDSHTMSKFKREIFERLPFISFAPIIFTSALINQRIFKILDLILQVDEESKKRIPTSEINRWLEKTIAKFPPSHASGKHAKIYYCTQQGVQPPTFIFYCNNRKLISENYKRYLHNQIRKDFKFTGSTIRLFYRGRKDGDEQPFE